MSTPLERAAEALIAKSVADEEALDAMRNDGEASEKDWDAAYDESLTGSWVCAGVVERIEGPPSLLARAALEAAIDEGEIVALVEQAVFATGTGLEAAIEAATAIKAHLLGGAE